MNNQIFIAWSASIVKNKPASKFKLFTNKKLIYYGKRSLL